MTPLKTLSTSLAVVALGVGLTAATVTPAAADPGAVIAGAIGAAAVGAIIAGAASQAHGGGYYGAPNAYYAPPQPAPVYESAPAYGYQPAPAYGYQAAPAYESAPAYEPAPTYRPRRGYYAAAERFEDGYDRPYRQHCRMRQRAVQDEWGRIVGYEPVRICR